MEKLRCYICDKCRKVLWHKGTEIPDNVVIETKDGKVSHYCKEHYE